MFKFGPDSKKAGTEEQNLSKANFPSRVGLATMLGVSLFIADKLFLSDIKADLGQSIIQTIFGVQNPGGGTSNNKGPDAGDIKDLAKELQKILPIAAALLLATSLMQRRRACNLE